jgi:alpha-mannosidase
VLENALVRYEFDRGGRLVRAFDKEEGREAMRPGDCGNVFSLYQDWPNYWDAWDIEQQAERQKMAEARLLDFRAGENGPAVQTLELEWAVGESRLTQEVRLAANSKRLDFVTKADWHESRKLLRVAFPVDVEAAEAAYEVQYGFYRRPTHRNTSWDAARFEVCAHRFADLSEADYGVALLNDCKYGYKVTGRLLEMSLLRAPFYPDPKADRGTHVFTYSLLPHAGRLEDSNVMAEAHALNQPPVVADSALAWTLPLEVTGGGVLVEAVKRAESGKGWIVRLYEPRGVRSTCGIRTRSPKAKLSVAGIMEEAREAVPLAKGAATLKFRPFEIKTLLVAE